MTTDLALPPHDFDAEVSLLGNWMRSDPKWLQRDHVPPEDFYDGTNQKAARVIHAIHADSTLVGLGDDHLGLGTALRAKATALYGSGANKLGLDKTMSLNDDVLKGLFPVQMKDGKPAEQTFWKDGEKKE